MRRAVHAEQKFDCGAVMLHMGSRSSGLFATPVPLLDAVVRWSQAAPMDPADAPDRSDPPADPSHHQADRPEPDRRSDLQSLPICFAGRSCGCAWHSSLLK